MKKERIYGWTLIFLTLAWLPCSQVRGDGGYFSSRSVAVSADQRAIIIKNGRERVSASADHQVSIRSAHLPSSHLFGQHRPDRQDHPVRDREDTVSSFNLPTAPLNFEKRHSKELDPEEYVEIRIRKTIGRKIRGLVVMWIGEFRREEVINELIKVPFPAGKRIYLTRLETRIDPVTMTEDISFKFDRRSKKFRVHSEGSEGSAHFRGIMFTILGLVIVVGLPVGFAVSCALLTRLQIDPRDR